MGSKGRGYREYACEGYTILVGKAGDDRTGPGAWSHDPRQYDIHTARDLEDLSHEEALCTGGERGQIADEVYICGGEIDGSGQSELLELLHHFGEAGGRLRVVHAFAVAHE